MEMFMRFLLTKKGCERHSATSSQLEVMGFRQGYRGSRETVGCGCVGVALLRGKRTDCLDGTLRPAADLLARRACAAFADRPMPGLGLLARRYQGHGPVLAPPLD